MTLSINTRNCSVSVDARDESTMVIALQMCAVGIPALTEDTFDLFRLRRLCFFSQKDVEPEDIDWLRSFTGMKVNCAEMSEVEFAQHLYAKLCEEKASRYSDLKDVASSLFSQRQDYDVKAILRDVDDESEAAAYDGLKWLGRPECDVGYTGEWTPFPDIDEGADSAKE
jgi:hypothetical protein